MLTDWLIFLDLLEENNCNTYFLRLITPITFAIIECHYYNYTDGYGFGSSFGSSNGSGNGSGSGSGYSYGCGYGYRYGNGYGYGDGYNDSNCYDEDH